MDSHMRRMTSLQRNQAIQVINAYAEAMNAGKGGGTGHGSEGTHDTPLEMTGVKVVYG